MEKLLGNREVQLAGQRCHDLPQAVQGVCPSSLGIHGDKLVSLGGGGQGNPGESPEESTGDGLKLEGEELQCEVGGREHAEF